jgi:MoxR-like ATPase
MSDKQNLDIFSSPKRLYEKLNENGYICTKELALIVYLAYKLDRPINLAGLPGCGKTEIAKQVAFLMNGTDPIRLQCYDGLSAEEALYSWNYQKQLLYIEANKNNQDWEAMENDLYSEKFISPRPLYKAITSDKKEVLLIDEIDKADEDFESFLLEFLAEQQISIAENKTIKAKNKPLVFITCNDKRELSEAFKRRCLFLYIDYPSVEEEIKIVLSHVPNINNLLVSQVVTFVDKIRNDKLKKAPSISETIDWAKTLVTLNVKELSPSVIKQTMNVLLKTQSDIEIGNRKTNQYYKELPKESIVKIDTVEDISDDEWNF